MKSKRLLAVLLTVVLLLGTVPLTAFASEWGQGDTLDSALSLLKVAFSNTQLDWLVLPTLGVVKLRYTYYLYKNDRTGTIDETPVYCIDPSKGGAYEIVHNIGPNPNDGSNTAEYIRGEKVGDVRYRAILDSGYPHRRLESIGVQSIEEAYYATKIALWLYIRGNSPSSLTINPAYGDNDPVVKRVLAAAIAIYNRGMTITPNPSKLTMTGKPSTTANLDANGDYYVQTIEITTNAWIGMNPDVSGDVQLSWDSPPPAGTIVLGTNGEDITASLSVKIVAYTGKVTIKYPAAAIDPNAFSPPALYAKALMPNDDIYVAYAEAGKDKYQKYLVERDPKTVLTAAFISQISDEPYVDELPADTGLRIRKVQAGTTIPLAGAVFEIRDPDGKLIYSLATNDQGIIDIPLTVTGNFTVTETIPPIYHTLPESRTQSATVRNGEIAEVTFSDTPYGALRVVKRDVNDGRPLAGACVRIRNIVTNTTQEALTDSSGSVYFDKLPCGAYEIVEVTAPNGYALDSAVHTVNVVPMSEGETSYVLTDKAKPGLRIQKFDQQLMTPIAGVTFEVYHDGVLYGTYVTDNLGEIELLNLPAGTYIAKEIAAPEPYVVDKTAQWVELKAGQGYIAELVFLNLTKPGIWLRKVDAETMQPLAGARFRVQQVGGSFSREYVTDANGEVNLTALEPGAYLVTELTAPNHYLIDDAQRTIQINAGERAQFVFTNTRKPSLIVKKFDIETAKPLPDTEFSVSKKDGTVIYEGLTNGDGYIRLDDLDEGWVTITEMAPPPGYLLSNPVSRDVYLVRGKVTEIKFDNARCPTLTIEKRDSVTGDPIPNVKFNVKFSPAGNFTGGVVDLGNYLTDSTGRIVLDNDLQSGWYRCTEIEPAPGYTMKEPVTQDIFLKGGDNKILYFENIPKSALVIRKINSATGLPVAGATFEVKYLAGSSGSGGTLIKTAVTSVNGTIVLTNLNPGTYVVSETIPAQGYQLSNPSTQTAYISGKEQDVVELVFTNPKMGHLVIAKFDSATKLPIAGVTFLVTDSSGAVIGPNNGEYTTDASGVIEITEWLPIGSTVNVKEIRCPDAYNMDAPPQSIKIMESTTHRLTFYDSPKSGLQVVKIDGISKKPLKDAKFRVYKANGEVIGDYVTDGDGLIIIPTLEPGWLKIVETQSPPGYVLDDTPKDVQITNNQFVKVVFENVPMASLQILKVDEAGRTPIPNVEFAVAKMNGERIGTFITDDKGCILINGLIEGWYTCTEIKAAKNYLLDTTPRNIEVKDGKVNTITITNKKAASVLLHKTDSLTGKGIYGVKFLISDALNNPLKVVTTDQDGYIYLTGLNLLDGKFFLTEIEPAPGYYPDTQVKTLYVEYGATSTIEWKNVPVLGQIQITKKSGDDNQINGLPKGTPLAGAVFEVLDYKTGNTVDRVISGTDGRAVSKPLPLGRYFVREVQAPQYYRLSDKTLDVEIEFATQIVKQEFINYSANTGVMIRKTGNVEAMPGDVIRYDIKEVRNTSTVPLTDFYWRDVLPVDAVRLTKIVTGTYSQSLQYKIMITTNKGDTRVIADNLSTTRNNVIDCSPASLGLRNDEYVTNFALLFGTVKAGFSYVEQPQIYVKVLTTLSNGYQFANKADVGGKYGGWIIGNSTWLTTIYRPKPGTLPRTGY